MGSRKDNREVLFKNELVPISLRVTRKQKAKWMNEALELDMTMSDYIYSLIEKGEKSDKTTFQVATEEGSTLQLTQEENEVIYWVSNDLTENKEIIRIRKEGREKGTYPSGDVEQNHFLDMIEETVKSVYLEDTRRTNEEIRTISKSIFLEKVQKVRMVGFETIRPYLTHKP